MYDILIFGTLTAAGRVGGLPRVREEPRREEVSVEPTARQPLSPPPPQPPPGHDDGPARLRGVWPELPHGRRGGTRGAVQVREGHRPGAGPKPPPHPTPARQLPTLRALGPQPQPWGRPAAPSSIPAVSAAIVASDQ